MLGRSGSSGRKFITHYKTPTPPCLQFPLFRCTVWQHLKQNEYYSHSCRGHRRCRANRLFTSVPHRLRRDVRPRPTGHSPPDRNRTRPARAARRRHGTGRLRLPAAQRHGAHRQSRRRLSRRELGVAGRQRAAQSRAWSARICSASTARFSSARARPSRRTPPATSASIVVGNPCNTNCLIAMNNAPRSAARSLVCHDPPGRKPRQIATRQKSRRRRDRRHQRRRSGAIIPPRNIPISTTPKSTADRPPR